MKLIIRKSDCEKLNKWHLEKNLLYMCKWLNFVVDDMHIQFSSDFITTAVLIDDFVADDEYAKNGAYCIYHRLPMKCSWDCYCAIDKKGRPISYDYINKDANILNRFTLGVMFFRGVETVEIDTRIYKC